MSFIVISLFLIRYSDHWRFVIQRLSFLASLLVYLESESLATRLDVAQLLGGRSVLHVTSYHASLLLTSKTDLWHSTYPLARQTPNVGSSLLNYFLILQLRRPSGKHAMNATFLKLLQTIH